MKEAGKHYCDTTKLSIRLISKDVAKENYLTELIDKIEIHVGGFGK